MNNLLKGLTDMFSQLGQRFRHFLDFAEEGNTFLMAFVLSNCLMFDFRLFLVRSKLFESTLAAFRRAVAAERNEGVIRHRLSPNLINMPNCL